MVDVTLCVYKDCPIGKDCLRLLIPLKTTYQAWANFGHAYSAEKNYCQYKIQVQSDPGDSKFESEEHTWA